MTHAKTKARANKTFIVQASLTIITYDCQNSFIKRPLFSGFTVFSNLTVTYFAATVSYARKMFMKLTPGRLQRSRTSLHDTHDFHQDLALSWCQGYKIFISSSLTAGRK